MERSFVITDILRVYTVGRQEFKEKRSNFFEKPGQLSRNELIYGVSGRSTVYFNEDIFETAPNGVRFLPKGPVSRYEVDRHEPGECIVVWFLTDRPVSDKAFVVNSADKERIGRLFKRIFSLWISKETGYFHECLSLLYGIFAELERPKYASSAHYLKIKPAIEKIHGEFLFTTPSVKELASLCGMREAYFTRLFKECYGTSPKQYLIRLRLDHATELLKTKSYSITAAAELSGFSDVFFFSRQFKSHLGVTPTEFMKNYRSSR